MVCKSRARGYSCVGSSACGYEVHVVVLLSGFVDMVDMLSDFGHGDRLSKIELMNALTKSGIFLSLVVCF